MAGRSRGAPPFVEPLQDLRCRELRQHVADRLIEPQFALFDELHRCYRGHGLRHRGEPEDRVERHLRAVDEIAGAERALVDDPLVIGRHGYDTGYILVLGRLAQGCVDLSVRWRSGGTPVPRTQRDSGGDCGRGPEEFPAGLRTVVHFLPLTPPRGSVFRQLRGNIGKADLQRSHDVDNGWRPRSERLA